MGVNELIEISYSMYGTFAFVRNIPIDAKNDDYVAEFVRKNPLFIGKVTLMKDTKYKEDDGSTYQRHYEYEVDSGKYCKQRYSDNKKWKMVVS